MSLFYQRSYYGELLLDQKQFSEASTSFDKAIEIEKSKWVVCLLVGTAQN